MKWSELRSTHAEIVQRHVAERDDALAELAVKQGEIQTEIATLQCNHAQAMEKHTAERNAIVDELALTRERADREQSALSRDHAEAVAKHASEMDAERHRRDAEWSQMQHEIVQLHGDADASKTAC